MQSSGYNITLKNNILSLSSSSKKKITSYTLCKVIFWKVFGLRHYEGYEERPTFKNFNIFCFASIIVSPFTAYDHAVIII